MAIQAAKHYWMCKAVDHILMFGLFLGLCAGFGYIGYLSANNRHPYTELVWGVMIVLTVALLTLVFFRHLRMLAADRGGYFLEAGVILMLVGSLFFTVNAYHAAFLIGMTCMSFFYAGYARLRQLLKISKIAIEY